MSEQEMVAMQPSDDIDIDEALNTFTPEELIEFLKTAGGNNIRFINIDELPNINESSIINIDQQHDADAFEYNIMYDDADTSNEFYYNSNDADDEFEFSDTNYIASDVDTIETSDIDATSEVDIKETSDVDIKETSEIDATSEINIKEVSEVDDIDEFIFESDSDENMIGSIDYMNFCWD